MKWLIKKYMVEAHIDSISELAREIGIPPARLTKRIADPSQFIAYEISALDKILHFSDEDLVRLIRGQA